MTDASTIPARTETLTLHIADTIILDYLSRYNREGWAQRVMEALRVGVVAIESATPALDATIVEQKFADAREQIKSIVEQFEKAVQKELSDHFDREKGDLPLALEKMLGDKGALRLALEQYFGRDSGRLVQILADKLGPGSEFAKKLDPNHVESVIVQISTKVRDLLDAQLTRITEQFSLDKPESALSRVKAGVEAEVQKLAQKNQDLMNEVSRLVGKTAGEEAEARRGTAKGRAFQVTMNVLLSTFAQGSEDAVEYVADTVGEVPRSKVGDSVVILGQNAGAPGGRIVFEAKKETGYSLRSTIEELELAKKNRSADFGVFVFSNGYQPSDMGPFRILGHDILCTLDEEAFERGVPPIYLEGAYRISRTFLIRADRTKHGAVDLGAVEQHVTDAISALEKFSDLKARAASAKKSIEAIESGLDDLRADIRGHLDKADARLRIRP